MQTFTGKFPANNAPLGNGKILVLLQQYRTGKPIDRIHYILYPDYSKKSSVLGEAGIDTVVKDYNYPLVNYDFDQKNGYISIDSARYIDGLPAYEVISHQGFIRLKTTTWIDHNNDLVIRKIETASMRKNSPRRINIIPRISVCGEVRSENNKLIICKNSDASSPVFMAIACTDGTQYYGACFRKGINCSKKFSNLPQIVIDDYSIGGTDFDEKILSSVPSLVDAPNLTFEAEVEVGDKWSPPVYLLIGMGNSEKAAFLGIQNIWETPEKSLYTTLSQWKKWADASRPLKCVSARGIKKLNYEVTLSKTILKQSLQEDFLAPFIGFRKYQGAVWVRDSLWICMSFAQMGYEQESYGILKRLAKIFKKSQNGYIYCVYDCKTGASIEDNDSRENDFAGLIVSAVWTLYYNTKKIKYLKEFKSLMVHCSEWICNNIDKSGLIIPCSGIWECFTPLLPGFQYEHMSWSSCISAWGLKISSEMCKKLGNYALSEKYQNASFMLQKAIDKYIIRNNILCRSKESSQLDASVLIFFTWFPLYENSPKLQKNTLKAIESRLKDPVLGGIWRHEDMTFIRGDGQPWIGPTLWLSEAYIRHGNTKKALAYLKWVLANTTECGLLPEAVINKKNIEGASMISYGHAGLLSMLYRIDKLNRKKEK